MRYFKLLILVIVLFMFTMSAWYIGYHQGWDAGRNWDFKQILTETIQEQQEAEKKQEEIDKDRPKPKTPSRRIHNV